MSGIITLALDVIVRKKREEQETTKKSSISDVKGQKRAMESEIENITMNILIS